MTANAFMSVSLEPPLVLVSVDRRTKMCNLLHEGCHYGVSVLCETQSALSDRFAGRAGRGPARAALRARARHPARGRRAGALRGLVSALLLGRRPLAVPGPRGVRPPPLGLAAALPRRALRAARAGAGSSASQALRAPVSSQTTGKNDSSSERSAAAAVARVDEVHLGRVEAGLDRNEVRHERAPVGRGLVGPGAVEGERVVERAAARLDHHRHALHLGPVRRGRAGRREPVLGGVELAARRRRPWASGASRARTRSCRPARASRRAPPSR